MAPSIILPSQGTSSHNGPPSPTPSARSNRSFLDEDPYPDGSLRRGSFSSSHATPSAASPQLGGGDLLAKLEGLLNSKANEIHLAGQLGAALLQQQQELETRIRELAEVQQSFAMSPAGQRRARGNGTAEDSDGEKEVGEETKRRLEELENDLKQWDESNSGLYQTVGMAAAQGVPSIDALQNEDEGMDGQQTPQRRSSTASFHNPSDAPSHIRQRAPSLSHPDVPASLSQTLATSSSTHSVDPSASRRARNNAQHRNNDIELATEIGQSLLSEVRRLQALLAEKEEHIKEMQKERDAVENELENQNVSRRVIEESVEKYKEENWNLELASQEMRNALTDSQAALQKADLERTRALKDLSTTRETLDTQRIETEKLTNQLETLRAKHETDMATMRKHTAGLQRDKSDLASTLEGLKTELATKSRGIKRSGSKQDGVEGLGDEDDRFEDEEGLEDDEDVFRGGARRKTGEGFLPGSPGDLFSEFGDESPQGSPAFQRDALNSDDSLKSGLAHAQRTIATLRTSLAREKAAKMDLRRQLAGAGGNDSWEDESEVGGTSTPARNGLAPGSARGARGSARGRGSASRRGARGGAAHGPSRLAKEFAGDSSIDSIDEEEVVDSFDSPGDGASIFEHHFPSKGGADEDDMSEGFDSPIPTRPRHRSHNSVHSIDMDPAFAHHQSDDDASIRSRDSYAPQSTLADVLGSNGRPASIASYSRGNRPISGMFSGFDIDQEASIDRPAPLVFTEVATMTDPLPEPALLEQLKAEHTQLRGEHTQLRDEHSLLQGQHSELVGQHSQLVDQHSQLVGKHSQLNDGHSQLKDGHSQLQNGHKQLQDEHSQLKDGHSRLVDEHSQLTNEHTQLKDGHSKLSTDHSTLQLSSHELAAALAAAQALHQQADSAHSRAVEDHSATQASLKQVEEERASALKDLETTREELQKIDNERTAALADLATTRETLKKVEEERTRALGDLAAAQKALEETQADRSRALEELSTTKATLEKANLDHAVALKDLAAAQEKHEQADSERTRVLAELAAVQQALQHAQADRSRALEDLSNSHEMLKQTDAERGAALEKVNADHASALKSLAAAEEKHQQVDSDRTRVLAELVTLRQTHVDRSRALEDLSATHETLKQTDAERGAALEKINADHAAALKSLAAAEEKHQQVNSDRTRVVAELAAVQATLQQAHADHSRAIEDLSTTQETLKQTDAERAAALKDLAAAREKHEQIDLERTRALDDLTNTRQTLDTHRSEKEKLSNELAALRAIPPPPPVSHVAVQATPEPLPVVRTTEVGVSTDPLVVPQGVEMEVQTDPLPNSTPVPTSVATFSTPTSNRAGRMEDRALSNQPSLSSLGIGKLSSFFGGYKAKEEVPPVPTLPQDDTIRSFAGIEGLRQAPAESDNESEDTDRAMETETETETDVEFEDARESIGAPTPTGSDGHNRSASLNDFHSVRSGQSTFVTAGSEAEREEDSESEVEVLRESPQRYRASKSRGVGSSTKETTPRKPLVVTTDASMQTEEWKPEPVIVYRTVATAASPAPQTPSTAGFPVVPSKRDSINTFGRAESPDALDESAAAATAFLGGAGLAAAFADRPLSPEEHLRPESALSSFSQITDDVDSLAAQSTLDKGKGPALNSLMGPPPTPSRHSTRNALRANAVPRKSNLSTASSASLRQPPPRPTSPPPADLLFRAQSPTFDEDYQNRRPVNGLLAPGMVASRSQGSSMPPPRGSASSQNLRVRPQTSMSMSEYANSQAQKAVERSKQSNARTPRQGPSSSAVSISDLSMHSDMSRRMSMASDRTSEGGFDGPPQPLRSGGDSTDPQVIHAITQTMIGEFLYKYTRRSIGKGHSEKRHRRFFWVHPYTKTLYWSSADPGAQNTNQSSAKSVFIEGVRQVLDPNPNPPGLHQGSIIVKTPNREMKITASTRERHDMWFNAINYLLARPDVPSTPGPASRAGTGPSSPATQSSRKSTPLDFGATPNSRLYNLTSQSDSRLTPKPTRGSRMSQSVGRAFKRSGTAAEEYERQNAFESPRSLRTYSGLIGADESIEVVDRSEIPVDFDEDDDGYEGLENVRACCGGTHDVGSLSRRGGGHHHHHRHSHHSDNESFATPLQTPSANRSRSKSAATGASSFSRRLAAASTSTTSSPQRRKPVPSLEPNAPLTPLAINTGARRQPSAP